MSHSISLSQLIQCEANALSSAIKGYKWELNPAGSNFHIVNIALKRASTSALLELCTKTDGQVQKILQEQLLKIFKKLEFAEQITRSFTSEDIDPRLESLLPKLEKLDISDSKKTEKYAASLNHLITNTTSQKTRQQAKASQSELHARRLKLLQTSPEVNICEISSSDLNPYYEGIDENNRLARVKIAQEKHLLSYFACALDENNQNKIDLFSQAFIRSLIYSGHDLASRKLYPHEFLQNINALTQHNLIQPMTNHRIALCADHTLDQTKECVVSLKKLKEENNLTDLSVHISSDKLNFAICMHSNTYFSVFNQHGDANSKFFPYIATFCDLDRVANFIHERICYRPVVYTPVCNRKKENESKLIDQFAAPIVTLQKMIDALSLQSEDGFITTLEQMLSLDEMRFHPSIDYEEIIERIDIHLQHIQKENHLQISSFEEGFYSSEKLRAIQRTQAELLLFLLEHTYKNEFKDSMVPEVFQILENIKLDAEDLPAGQKNLATNLFEKLDSIYFEAYKKNPLMLSPYHVSFNKDFARNAFIGAARNLVPDKYKIRAVEEVGQSLKATWNI